MASSGAILKDVLDAPFGDHILNKLNTTATTISTLSTTARLSLVFVITFGLVWVYYQRKFANFDKRHKGLTGPTPVPVFGNLLPMLFRKRPALELEWHRKYGDIYRVFIGSQGVIVNSDPEVHRELCIKNSQKILNSWLGNFPVLDFQANSLFFLRDHSWKRVRTVMTPTFTTGKIRQMFSLLQKTTDEFVDLLSDAIEYKNKESIDAKGLATMCSLDGISTCCYATRLERKDSLTIEEAAKKNPYIKVLVRLLKFTFMNQLIAMFMPLKFYHLVNKDQIDSVSFLSKYITKVLDSRKGIENKFDDYLAIMQNANNSSKQSAADKTTSGLDKDEQHVNDVDQSGQSLEAERKQHEDMVEQVRQVEGKDVVLSQSEMLSNLMILMIVGTETTSNFIANSMYALAFHQDVQDKLYEELSTIVKKTHDGRLVFEHDDVVSLPYLHAVLHETLRIMPPVKFLLKEVSQEHTINKFNVTLYPNDVVQLGIYNMHMDPRSWPEPEKFIPDRFLPENKNNIVPGSYSPFNLGPRMCIGMRFTLAETKLALAKVVMTFRINKAPNTKFPVETKRLDGFLTQFKDQIVCLSRR